MKVLTTSIASAIAACALVSTASAIAPAGPTVEYDSYDNPGNTSNVTNTGSTATAGTYYAPSTVSIVTGPSVGPNNTQAFHFNDGNGGGSTLATGINSNQTLGNVISPADDSFTMSAWVNLDAGAEANNADNMVFGTNGGAPMHLGFRGGQAYFGFWNNDSNQATTVDPTGTFQYFSWVYDGTANTQSIYENGVLLGTATGKGHPGQVGELLTVGTNGGNGGDLAGAISDPTVYNTAYTAGQETALYNAQFNAVPEPSTWMAAGGLILLAAGDFRRRLKP